jgi:hypothetical protein
MLKMWSQTYGNALAKCGRHLVRYGDVASEQQWQLFQGRLIAYVVASGLEVQLCW